MSFERLKASLEQEAVKAQMESDRLRKASEEARAIKLQKENQERDFHEQRRKQASSFREQAKISTLFAELTKVVKGEVSTDYTVNVKLTDNDSFLDVYSWERCGAYDEAYHFKFFAVETRPDGKVVIHHNTLGFWGDTKTQVDPKQWKVNPKSLEDAFEKGYRNSLFHSYTPPPPSYTYNE